MSALPPRPPTPTTPSINRPCKCPTPATTTTIPSTSTATTDIGRRMPLTAVMATTTGTTSRGEATTTVCIFTPTFPSVFSCSAAQPDTDSDVDVYGKQYPPSQESLGPPRIGISESSTPTFVDHNGVSGREPYPAWSSERQIPLSKEEIEDIFLDLTQKFGFQRDSMRNMVRLSSHAPSPGQGLDCLGFPAPIASAEDTAISPTAVARRLGAGKHSVRVFATCVCAVQVRRDAVHTG